MADNTQSPQTPGKRIVSIDAFRGFVMFSMLIHTFGLEKLSHYPVIGFIHNQLTHAPWRGFHFEDIILPWFLFIIGVSISLSESKRQQSGEDKRKRLIHAAKRSITLFILGFILSWIDAGKPYFGPGVLQVLAFAYFGCYLFIDKSIKYRWSVFAALLFIYWFFIFIIPVPEAGRNSYILFKNLVYLIDNSVTGSTLRWGYLYPLSTSIAVVVYGSIIGSLLINRTSHKQFMKTLVILGIAGVLSGLILHPVIPIIKRMFTSSYTLFSCGLLSFIFMLFYWLIDVKGHTKWCYVFIVFGMNSIFVYILNGLLKTWLLGTGGIFIDPLMVFIGEWVSPVKHLAVLIVEWLVCLWLFRRKIFFRL